jgi:hypothetical protein
MKQVPVIGSKALMLTCPFCGALGVIEEVPNFKKPGSFEYVTSCSKKEACPMYPISDAYHTEKEAIAAWNTRI